METAATNAARFKRPGADRARPSAIDALVAALLPGRAPGRCATGSRCIRAPGGALLRAGAVRRWSRSARCIASGARRRCARCCCCRCCAGARATGRAIRPGRSTTAWSAFRSGWLDQHWRFAETAQAAGGRVAAVAVRPPLRHGHAALRHRRRQRAWKPALAIPYLPEADAARACTHELVARPAPSPGAGRLTRSRTAASAAPAW